MTQGAGEVPTRQIALSNVIVGTGLEQFGGDLGGGHARDGDDGDNLIPTTQLFQTVEAVPLIEMVVEDHEVDAPGVKSLEGGLFRTGVQNVKSQILDDSEMVRDQETLRHFIFDMEELDDAVGHDVSLRCL